MACRILSINRSRHAFTLAESLVASVVLAIAVAAVSGAIVAAQSQNHAQEEDSTAISLARQMMEEIASRPLRLPDGTPGWPTVTDRSTYDTINDYNGYTDTVSSTVYRTNAAATSANFTSALPPVTVVPAGASSVQLGPGQYSRTASVTYPTTIFATSVNSGDFAVVTVTVQGQGIPPVKLSRLFSNLSITR